MFRVTALFTERGDQTVVAMTASLSSAEEASQTSKFIKEAGGNSTWVRLAEHLEARSSGVGYSMTFLRADVRAGGGAVYSMIGDHGTALHGKFEYLEIQRPTSLSYVQSFCDADGRVTRYPAEPRWPEKMRTQVIFAQEIPGLTLITVQWNISGDATPDKLEIFTASRGGMTQGWTGSFDKLDGVLESS